MSTPRTSAIRFAPIVALILGFAALMLALVAAAFYPIGLILGVAATLVGAVAAYNNRGDRINFMLGNIAVAFGVVVTIVVLVLIAT